MSTDIAVISFPLGTFSATVRDGVVTAAVFDAASHPEHRDAWGVYDTLAAYFAGDVDALDRISVEPEYGTPFQRDVWKRLREIRPGAPISYGELARRVGYPNASRAVGSANGANPIALIVPCHRVIRTGGALGGYAFGLKHKRWLLDHEANVFAVNSA